MTRRALLLLLAVPLFAGWIFFRQARRNTDEYAAAFQDGRSAVTVSFVPAGAVQAADDAEAALRAEGWKPAPVSTPTFRLLVKGQGVAALLAEDLRGQTRVTLLKTRP